ncbi:MAG TPA: hypothetical protein VLZ05_15390 [Mycobacterium sp.]|nr:hypothetical protein [Mycobacterium sp.]HUH70112.1 hypothetical protein [Mycobacterium sp.]
MKTISDDWDDTPESQWPGERPRAIDGPDRRAYVVLRDQSGSGAPRPERRVTAARSRSTYRLHHGDPRAFELDHYVPVAAPELALEPSNFRAAHAVCNKRRAAASGPDGLGWRPRSAGVGEQRLPRAVGAVVKRRARDVKRREGSGEWANFSGPQQTSGNRRFRAIFHPGDGKYRFRRKRGSDGQRDKATGGRETDHIPARALVALLTPRIVKTGGAGAASRAKLVGRGDRGYRAPLGAEVPQENPVAVASQADP